MAWWSPVKVGEVVREELMKAPRTGVELHGIYKRKVKEANALTDRKRRRPPQCYESFMKTLRLARYLGFITPVAEEPIGVKQELLSIRDLEVVPSTRVRFALTKKGREAPPSVWANLRGAVRDILGWK